MTADLAVPHRPGDDDRERQATFVVTTHDGERRIVAARYVRADDEYRFLGADGTATVVVPAADVLSISRSTSG